MDTCLVTETLDITIMEHIIEVGVGVEVEEDTLQGPPSGQEVVRVHLPLQEPERLRDSEEPEEDKCLQRICGFLSNLWT